MINFRRSLILVSLVSLAGCPAPYKGSDDVIPMHESDCDANARKVPITINYQQDEIKVVGPNQDVYEGYILRFNLVGSNNVRVSTSGKTATDGWLNGSGKRKANKPASERFDVCVPTDLFEGEPDSVQKKDFYYNVDAVGHDRLDPVVPVRRLN